MSMQTPMHIDKVVHISSNGYSQCPHCLETLDGAQRWDQAVNHMMEKHGYRLLHTGGEASTDDSNKSIQHTVAVLGRPG